MNCCYQCENRHMHCHVECEEYKAYATRNAVERDKRARESRVRQNAYDHMRETVNAASKRRKTRRKFYGS